MLTLIGFVQLNSKPPRKTYCPVGPLTLLLLARYLTHGHQRMEVQMPPGTHMSFEMWVLIPNPPLQPMGLSRG